MKTDTLWDFARKALIVILLMRALFIMLKIIYRG